jgi:hypothetical protein
MSDTPAPATPAAPRNESYRLCGACGLLTRRHDPFCPECGAEPGAEHPARPPHTHEKSVCTFIVFLALLGALVLLSLNRTAAIEAETLQRRVLAPIDPAGIVPPPAPAELADVPAPDVQPAAPVPAPTQPPPAVVRDAPAEPDPFGDSDDDDVFANVDEDPFGQPDTPPATAAPDEPAPPTRAERIQQRRAELIEEYTALLDQNHPMHRVGERVTLRLNDGTTQSGVLQQLASGQVQLRLATGEARWFFSRQLAPETRLRVDPSERQAIVEERAWEEALREIQGTP